MQLFLFLSAGGNQVALNLTALGLGRYLPCSILSRKPYVLAAYDYDFLDCLDAFEQVLPRNQMVTLLIQLGWQCQTANTAKKLVKGLRAARERLPQIGRILMLANEPEEVTALSAQGEEAVFCHQNAFLDERRYPVLPFVRKRYDAIYVARITPFKRHALLSEMSKVRLIGTFSENERTYAESILQNREHVRWSNWYPAHLIAIPMNQARCGLCLSAEEGAMFVSAEYLLCGLPVVNTPNIGGRDLVMPDFAVKRVAAETSAVADAVRQWQVAAPPAADIREATLSLMRPHRRKLLEILQEIGVAEELCEKYARRFPHKLGLRCSRSPLQNLAIGLPRPDKQEGAGCRVQGAGVEE
jgi:glycosyltransferase involved in cell wall biosynthesis